MGEAPHVDPFLGAGCLADPASFAPGGADVDALFSFQPRWVFHGDGMVGAHIQAQGAPVATFHVHHGPDGIQVDSALGKDGHCPGYRCLCLGYGFLDGLRIVSQARQEDPFTWRQSIGAQLDMGFPQEASASTGIL